MENIIETVGLIIEVLAIMGITIEVIPIKLSPLSWIGKRINEDIKKEINTLKKDVSELKKTTDYCDIGTIRSRISNFDLLVRKDINLDTLERHQYITALKDIDKWNKYHLKYPSLNGELKLAIENIEDSYKRATFKDN